MKLNFLLQSLGLESPFGDAEISGVTDKTERVREGSLFVAIEGAKTDGHLLAAQALEMGAAAVVTQRNMCLEHEITVRDTRLAYSFLCSAFFSAPQDGMIMIGVTGTNGKTTTAEYLKHILEASGRRCGIIGTLGCGIDEHRQDSGYTTPSCDILFSQLRAIADAGCKYCVMEVSSQALEQRRVDAIEFKLGIFTNIGSDHLDYHGKMSCYIKAKSRLFMLSENALFNADDAYADSLAGYCPALRPVYYSARGGYADFMAKNIKFTDDGVSYLLVHNSDIESVRVKGIGDFVVYNSLAAISAALCLGVNAGEAATAAADFPAVRGRTQCINASGFRVFIDFAHTPEALSAVIKALKRQCRGRLITVFGCGGDRDKFKRPEMGRIASLYSDSVIVTSDNPRSEKPEDIIADIMAGAKAKSGVFTEPDRAKAIALALNKASADDIVLIAGKGHEEYQIINGEKIFFSDEKTVKRLIGKY